MTNTSISREAAPSTPSGNSETMMRALVRFRGQLRDRASGLTQCRHDADDLVQRVIERALNHPEVFRPGYNYWGWLLRVMRNMFLDDCRMRRVRKSVSLDVAQMVQAAGASQLSPCDLLTADDVRDGIAKLPPLYRDLMVLVHVSGHSCREISEQLGIGCNTLGVRLLRARRRLRSLLEETYRDKVRSMGDGRRQAATFVP